MSVSHEFTHISIRVFFFQKPYFSRPKILVFLIFFAQKTKIGEKFEKNYGENFQKIAKFCHFCFFSKKLNKFRQSVSKTCTKMFLKIIRPFLAITWGFKHKCHFLPFFFSSACKFWWKFPKNRQILSFLFFFKKFKQIQAKCI